MLRQYARNRTMHIKQTSVDLRQIKRLKYSNVQALARHARPGLVPRPRGKLWNQNPDATLADMRQSVHEGDQQALAAYIEEHHADLVAQQEANHAAAKELEAVSKTDIPYSNADWIEWLEAHDGRFQELLKTASATRRQFSQRLVASEPLPASARIHPKVDNAGLPMWVRKMLHSDPGFFALKYGACVHKKVVLWFCSLRTYLVLRAWMLWRSTRDGWKDRKSCRAIWWMHEHDKLRSAISALSCLGGGSGNAAADAMIRQWCPGVLG